MALKDPRYYRQRITEIQEQISKLELDRDSASFDQDIKKINKKINGLRQSIPSLENFAIQSEKESRQRNLKEKTKRRKEQQSEEGWMKRAVKRYQRPWLGKNRSIPLSEQRRLDDTDSIRAENREAERIRKIDEEWEKRVNERRRRNDERAAERRRREDAISRKDEIEKEFRDASQIDRQFENMMGHSEQERINKERREYEKRARESQQRRRQKWENDEWRDTTRGSSEQDRIEHAFSDIARAQEERAHSEIDEAHSEENIVEAEEHQAHAENNEAHATQDNANSEEEQAHATHDVAESEEEIARANRNRANEINEETARERRGSGGGSGGNDRPPRRSGPGWIRRSWRYMKKQSNSLRDNIRRSYYRDTGMVTTNMVVTYCFITFIIHFFIKFPLDFNPAITWVLDILLAVITYFFIFDKTEREMRGFRVIFTILFLELFLTMILVQVQKYYPIKIFYYYLTNRLLTPWWFYFALIRDTNANTHSKFVSILRFIVILFWIGVILSIPAIGFAKVSPMDYVGKQQSEIAFDFYYKSVDFYNDMITELIPRAFMTIGDAWERQLKIATGGYYKGRVDENQDVPLGVYLEKVRPAAPEFYLGSPVSVYGKLRVMSLDDGINLKVDCFQGKRKLDGSAPSSQNQYADEVYPKDNIWLYELETEDIDCIFKNIKERGTHTITTTANFNFETMSYLKTYFMNKDTVRSLIAQGKDPLDEYGVKDKNPTAVYTSGPVMVGMGISSQPVGIENPDSEKPQTLPRIGITVESNTGWLGRIKEIKELMVFLPDGISLELDTCNFVFREDNPQEDEDSVGVKGYRLYRTKQFKLCQEEAGLTDNHFGDNGEFSVVPNQIPQGAEDKFTKCLDDEWEKETAGYNVYYLDTSMHTKEFENIDQFLTFSCRMKIDDPASVMGYVPLATHYISAKARYNYEIDSEVSVTVKNSGMENEYDDTPTTATGKLREIKSKYGEYIEKWVKEINENSQLGSKIPKSITDESLLSECIILGLLATESYGDLDAKSSSGAYGLMQIIESTAKGIVRDIAEDSDYFLFQDFPELENIKNPEDVENSNPNLRDPSQNIMLGSYYFAQRLLHASNMLKHIEDSEYKDKEIIKYALAEYNAGLAQVMWLDWDSGSRDNYPSSHMQKPRCLQGKESPDNGKYTTFDYCYDKLPDETQDHNYRTMEYQRECVEGHLDDPIDIEEESEVKWVDAEDYLFYASYSNEDIEDARDNAKKTASEEMVSFINRYNIIRGREANEDDGESSEEIYDKDIVEDWLDSSVPNLNNIKANLYSKTSDELIFRLAECGNNYVISNGGNQETIYEELLDEGLKKECFSPDTHPKICKTFNGETCITSGGREASIDEVKNMLGGSESGLRDYFRLKVIFGAVDILHKSNYLTIEQKPKILSKAQDSSFPGGSYEETKDTKYSVGVSSTRMKMSSEENSDEWNFEDSNIVFNLFFNKNMDVASKILQEIEEKDENYVNFGKNIFVKALFNGCWAGNDRYVCTLKTKFVDKFSVNSPMLEKDLERGEDALYHYPLNDLLKIRLDQGTFLYTSVFRDIELIITDHDEDQVICKMDWEDSIMQDKCVNREYLTGLGITVVDLFPDNMNNAEREELAKVQIQYDPYSFTADCCDENPKSCLKDSGFALGTCEIDDNNMLTKEGFTDCTVSVADDEFTLGNEFSLTCSN